MKLFKFLSMGLLFISLIACNNEGEVNSSKLISNEVETENTVAPVVQSNPVDISALGEERVVSLKTSVTDPQHLPVTLEQVISLSKDCQDPTIIDPDDLTFSIDNSEPETCFYQYTVKNHTDDPALDKTAKGITHTFLPGMKRLPPISEVTTVGKPLTIDLEAQLGEEYPDGYVLDEEVIVVTGSGEAIANTSTNSITFTPDEEDTGTTTLSYTLNDPNGTESEMGFIYIGVSGPGNTAPVAEDFLGPQNVEPEELVYVDVADSISDPDGDELNLVNVDAYSATLEIINDTQFSFKADIPGVYNVRYTVSDNRGGEAGAFVTIVIPARTLLPWDDIFFNNVLVYTAPWEKEVADGENIGYTETKPEWVDRTKYDIALFDYDNAVFTCERYGMELPTEGQLLDLFNHFNSQGINIQDADGNAWPVSVNYVSSDSNVSVNLVNGDVNDSESPDTPLMLTCAFPSLLQVTVTTDSAYVLENGETPESDNYNLVQAKVFNSSGLPDEGETVFIKSTYPTDTSLTFTQPNGITDDNGEFTFGVTSSKSGDFYVTVSYMEQNIPVLVTFLEDKVSSLDISGSNEVVIGEQIQLMAETTDSQGNVVDVTPSATWSSDDVSIASVNAGSVFGVSLGETNVSADYAGVSASPMTITVVDSFGEDGYIEVTPESVNLDTEENNTKEFSATLYSTAYPDGKDITSDPATTWQVTDGDGVVGSLNENVFTASGAGSATVEAQYEILETGEVASDTAEITVEAASGPVFEIEGPTEVVVDDYIRLVAKLDGEVQTNPPGYYNVIGWTSSNPEIASVDTGGYVTGNATGTVTITATLKDESIGVEPATYDVTVTPEPWGGDYMEIIPESVSLDVDDSQAFTVKLYTEEYPDGGETTDAIWTLNEPNGDIGDLSGEDNNVFTATNAGSGSIMATFYTNGINKLTATASIEVKNDLVTVTTFEIKDEPETLEIGSTDNLTAWVTYSNGLSKNVTEEADWSSNNTSKLSVSNEEGSKGEIGTLDGASDGDLVTASANYLGLIDTSEQIELTESEITLSSVEITNTAEDGSDNIKIGGTYGYQASAYYSDGSSVDITNNATWTSSDSSVAKFSYQGAEPGVVTGLKVGNTTVTVTYIEDGIERVDTTPLEVTEGSATVTSFEIRDEPATLEIGGTDNLTAWLVYSDGTSEEVTEKANWKSNNTNKLSVNNVYGGKGEIGTLDGASDGDLVTANASYEGWNDTSEKIELTEATATMTALEIREAPESLAIGDTDNLEAWAVYDDGTSIEVTDETGWESKNPNRISVNDSNDKGLIEALSSPGYSATIQATYGEFSDTVSIEVTEGATVVTSFEIRDEPTSLEIGSTHNLTAWLVYSNGTSEEVTEKANWKSNNTSKLSVSNVYGSKGEIGTLDGASDGDLVTANASYGDWSDTSEKIELTEAPIR